MSLEAEPGAAEGRDPIGVERVPLSRMRRRIGDNMVSSLAVSPHVTLSVDVDYQRVEQMRSEAAARDDFGPEDRLTYLAFVAVGTCGALGEFGDLNASIDGTDLLKSTPVNLGIAVDLDQRGLVVPVIHDAQALAVGEMSRAIAERGAAAAERRLTPDDVSRGTFTISSPGRAGADRSTPIIHQPQVAILAVDAIRDRVVPSGTGDTGIHPVGALSLSFDHRAVDGVYASAFLRAIQGRLESEQGI